MLLGRIVPIDEYDRIMNLPAVDRWNTIRTLTEGKDLATTPIRPLRRFTKAGKGINNFSEFELVRHDSRPADAFIVQSNNEPGYFWNVSAKARNQLGYDIKIPYGSAYKTKPTALNDNQLIKLCQSNGYGGGCLNGDVPAGARDKSSTYIRLADYARPA